jgi:hypothetical protein
LSDINAGKDLARAPQPLLLAKIVASDGDTVYLSSAYDVGQSYLAYGGNHYQTRLLDSNVGAIQAMSALGLDVPPSMSLKIDDGDAAIWTNHYNPHGWGGATITLTFIQRYVGGLVYSSDSITWSFLGGAVTRKAGVLTIEATSRANFQRVKLPGVPIQRRCWKVFPATPADQLDCVTNKQNPGYHCGYSAGQSGGVGNYQTGTTPFTDCDKTRQACIARLGNPSSTSVAPDGDIGHDTHGNVTGRFGGITWIAPTMYQGKKYTTGQQVTGFNVPNDSILGGYWPEVLGTQWVRAKVVNTAADPNTLRGEAVICYAPWGPVSGPKVLINGEEIPQQNPSDPNFSWGFLNTGGRNGALNAGPIFDKHGDPYGSVAAIWWVVPSELANDSAPTIDVLISGPSILAISGTGASPVYNYVFTVNPIWHLLYIIMRSGYTLADLDANSIQSMIDAAAICDTTINYMDLNGNAASHARWRSSFVLSDDQRQTIAQIIVGLRNNCGIVLSPNSADGLFQVFMERTLADQQPSPVPGSNYNTAVASEQADGTAANGYYAYLFTEADYDASSLEVSTLSLQDTPNKITIPFQDEDNQFQTDSLALVDPDGYAAASNQEIESQTSILGICNFDQAMRRGNMMLSKARRGNSRDDAKGTEIIKFTTTQKAVHLASRPGFICAIQSQQLSL